MKKRNLCVLLLVMFMLPIRASEPEAIIVHLQGDAKQSTLLANVKKIYFFNDNVILEKNDESQITHSIDDISKIIFGNMLHNACDILKSFTVKETSGDIDCDDNTITVADLNTDQNDCMEVYFELNSEYSLDDYEVYLEGDNGVNEQLGILDIEGKPYAYICFDNVFGWTGTLYVVQKSTASTIETYNVTILDVNPTGFGSVDATDKEVQETQCYTVTGIRISCNATQGIIIKRTIFTDGSVKVVKELK